MNFFKGILAGATIGMMVGTMKSSEIMSMYKKGKKYLRKMKSVCM